MSKYRLTCAKCKQVFEIDELEYDQYNGCILSFCCLASIEEYRDKKLPTHNYILECTKCQKRFIKTISKLDFDWQIDTSDKSKLKFITTILSPCCNEQSLYIDIQKGPTIYGYVKGAYKDASRIDGGIPFGEVPGDDDYYNPETGTYDVTDPLKPKP